MSEFSKGFQKLAARTNLSMTPLLHQAGGYTAP